MPAVLSQVQRVFLCEYIYLLKITVLPLKNLVSSLKKPVLSNTQKNRIVNYIKRDFLSPIVGGFKRFSF